MARRHYHRLYVEAYAAHGRHRAAWDRLARQYVAAEAEALATNQRKPKAAAIDALADKLLTTGVDDALVCSLLGQRLWHRLDLRAGEWLRRALTALPRSPYPPAAQFELPFAAAELLRGSWPDEERHAVHKPPKLPAPGPTETREAERLQELGTELLVRALSEPPREPWERRLLWRHMSIEECWRDGYLSRLAARLQAEPQLDPWYGRLAAPSFVWDWWMPSLFRGHLGPFEWLHRDRQPDETDRSLVAAWRLHPEFPEAATYLLACLSTFDRQPDYAAGRRWFDRAVAAQFDYQPAYRYYLRLLGQGPGGRERLLAFGEECLATGRFDTAVPAVYLKAVGQARDVTGDAGVWREKPVQQHLDRLFAGYLAEPSRRAERSDWHLVHAAVLHAGGRHAEAYRQLGQVPRGAPTDALRRWADRAPELQIGEICAYAGPGGALVQQAERTLRHGNQSAARRLYQAAARAGGDPRARVWLADRIKACGMPTVAPRP